MQSEPTCFLDVCAVFCVAGLLAEAHQVDGKDSEDILIPHDEVRHNAVGTPVLLVDSIPLLHMNHKKDSVFQIQYFQSNIGFILYR